MTDRRIIFYATLIMSLLRSHAQSINNYTFSPVADMMVITDGLFTEPCWKESTPYILNDSISLYLLKSQHNLAIGIKNSSNQKVYVDLYLQTIDTIWNLHASMKLGQRKAIAVDNLLDLSFPPWVWGNNVGWIANITSLDNRMDKSLDFHQRSLPAEGIEFFIDRTQPGWDSLHFYLKIKHFTDESVLLAIPDLHQFMQVN